MPAAEMKHRAGYERMHFPGRQPRLLAVDLEMDAVRRADVVDADTTVLRQDHEVRLGEAHGFIDDLHLASSRVDVGRSRIAADDDWTVKGDRLAVVQNHDGHLG